MARDYRRLSVEAKQRRHRLSMREPSIACPHCETKTTVDGLLPHIAERCKGRRAPHPRSQWISADDALALGVGRALLRRWVRAGRVLIQGSGRGRRYLHRDIVRLVAMRRRPGRGTK